MKMFVLIFLKFDHVSGRQENAGAWWRLVEREKIYKSDLTFIYLLGIYQSHSLIPSSSPFFLPFVATSIYSAYLLACQTRDQSPLKCIYIEIRLYTKILYIYFKDTVYPLSMIFYKAIFFNTYYQLPVKVYIFISSFHISYRMI